MNLGLIFDIDGVLIKVEGSFHQAIIHTVPLYFEHVLDMVVDKQLIQDEDIAAFKAFGGFNDDWDLTAGLLYYLVSLLDDSMGGLEAKNVPQFLAQCDGSGLEAILKGTGGKNADWVLFDRAPMPAGKIAPGNLVKRIFQEVYWGPLEFERIYRQEPQCWLKPGMIECEEPLMPLELLQKLAEESSGMAIATGREREDALYSLNKFSYAAYFDTIITLSDVGEAYKKPHPHSLERIQIFFKEQGLSDLEYIYVGDQIDDMLMAQRAQDFMSVLPIGFLYQKDPVRMKKMSAMGIEHIVSQAEDVLQKVLDRKASHG